MPLWTWIWKGPYDIRISAQRPCPPWRGPGPLPRSSRPHIPGHRMPHPAPIYFSAPGLKRYETAAFCQRNPAAFTAISVTAERCALNCDHCQGQLLRHMRPLGDGESLFSVAGGLARQGAKGVLVSGGAGPDGAVPLASLADEMARLKAELDLRVLVHTGLVDRAQARALAEA